METKGQTYRVKTMYPHDTEPRPIELAYYHKSERMFKTLIYENGKAKLDMRPAQNQSVESPIAKVILSQFEIRDKSERYPNGKKYFYNEITVFNDEEIADGLDKRENDGNKLIIEMLKHHPNIVYKKKDGFNINKNIAINSLIYELEDISGKLWDDVQRRLITTIALQELKNWSVSAPQQMVNFAYLWGIKNIGSLTNNKLYKQLYDEVNNNPMQYSKVRLWLDDEVVVFVKRAMMVYTKDSRTHIISQNGNHLMFNGQPVGKTMEDAINHFKTNAQDWLLLQREMPEISKLPQVELVKDSQAVPPAVINVSVEQREKSEVQIMRDKQYLTIKIKQVILDNKNIFDKQKGKFVIITNNQHSEIIKRLRDTREASYYLDWFDNEVNLIKEELQIAT